jgi:hypothetical protein
MFLNNSSYKSWDSDDGSHAQGLFILLFQHKWRPGDEPMPCELRVLVRRVRFNQLGNFMMGKVAIKCPSREDAIALSLSGSFGNDNLPIACPDGLWDYLHPVPQDVADHYWKTPEGNEPGHGAKAIYDWTQTQGDSLQRLRKGSSAGGEAGKPD